MDHNPEQKYSVYDAIKYMNDVHRNRQTIEKPIKLSYRILNENQEAIISDALLLGKQSRFDFFEHTAGRYRHLFSDDEETLIQLNQFLDDLEGQYERELIERYDVTNFIDQEPSKNEPNSNSDSNLEIISEEVSSEQTSDNKLQKEAKEKERKHMAKAGQLKITSKNSWKIATVAIVTTLVIFLGRQVVISDETLFRPDFNSLMAEARYGDALEYYPENIHEIEREIFLQGQEGIDELEILVADYPNYQPGKFDLAYLKQDYPSVIELKNIADSPGRKAQLAIAYIKEGHLREAEILNQELKNQDISDLIQDTYLEKGISAIKNNDLETAKSYQEKANNNDLKEVIDSLEKIDLEINELEKNNKDTNQDKIEKLKEESERIKLEL